MDLTKYTNDHPYFYDGCLHSGKGKNSRAATVFKTAQFSLFIIVPAGQWLEFEDFREKCECKRPMSQAPFILAPRAHQLLTHHIIPPNSVDISIQSANSTSSLSTISDSHSFNAISASISAKRHHQCSGTNTSSQSLPPKKSMKATGVFTSPDQNTLREALQARGAMDFNIKEGKLYLLLTLLYSYLLHDLAMKQKMEPVNFHPIPTIDLTDLIGDNVAFDIKSSDIFFWKCSA